MKLKDLISAVQQENMPWRDGSISIGWTPDKVSRGLAEAVQNAYESASKANDRIEKIRQNGNKAADLKAAEKDLDMAETETENAIYDILEAGISEWGLDEPPTRATFSSEDFPPMLLAKLADRLMEVIEQGKAQPRKKRRKSKSA